MIPDNDQQGCSSSFNRRERQRPTENLLISGDGDPPLSCNLGYPHFVGCLWPEMIVVSLDGQARGLEGIREDMSAQVAIDEEYPAQAALS